MSPEFRNLLIKEWSERRRLFLFGLALLSLYLGYGLAYEVEYRTRAFVASYYSTCMGFGWFGAVLLAMSTATGEYTQRTLRFSASLPISLRTVAWARLLGAWGCLAVPMLLGAILVSLLMASGLIEQAGLRPWDYGSGNAVRLPERPSLSLIESLGFLWSTTAIAIVVALHSVTLISWAGTYCRSEGVVGFLGAIIALFSTSFTAVRPELDKAQLIFLRDWIGGVIPGSMAISWGYGELDGSSYSDLELAPLILGPLVVNVVITLGFGAWFARRYGCRREYSASPQPRTTRRWWPRWPNPWSWFRLRWPGRIPALVWLDARQSVPLCLAGLTVAVLITILGLSESQGRGTVSDRLMGELPSSTWFVGILWGAIVAVAIFSPELKPALEQFWRSRPIAPSAWFWTKFVVGLVALLATLDLIPALLAQVSSYQPENGRVGMAYAACFPLLHAMVYALAVAAICRLRRPIPAAITALVLFFAVDQILESIPVYPRLSTMNVYNRLNSLEEQAGHVNLSMDSYPLVYGLVVLITLAAMVFASRMAIPPVVGQRRLGLLLFVGLFWAQVADAAETPSAAEIVAGIRQRESLVKTLHLRVRTRQLRTAASLARQRSPADQEEHKRYEYYDRPPYRGWTEIDDAGNAQSYVTFNGSLHRNFNVGQARSELQGTITAGTQAPTTPFATPEVALATCFGHSLTDLIESAPPEAFAFREDGRDHLVDMVISRTVTSFDDFRSPQSVEHRFQITVNLSRDFWPVRIQMEVLEQPQQRLVSRNIVTASGWIDAGPIVYPQTVEQQSFMNAKNRPADSEELIPFMTQSCAVELVEINTDIPDAVFERTFPSKALIYDSRDRKWYKVDDAGVPQPYIPQPKGLRGAVLVYHLLWISGAVIYLFRRTPQA